MIIELVSLQRHNNFIIESSHIKGELNVEADKLSREEVDFVITRSGKRIKAIQIDPNLYLQKVVKLLLLARSFPFGSTDNSLFVIFYGSSNGFKKSAAMQKLIKKCMSDKNCWRLLNINPLLSKFLFFFIWCSKKVSSHETVGVALRD